MVHIAQTTTNGVFFCLSKTKTNSGHAQQPPTKEKHSWSWARLPEKLDSFYMLSTETLNTRGSGPWIVLNEAASGAPGPLKSSVTVSQHGALFVSCFPLQFFEEWLLVFPDPIKALLSDPPLLIHLRNGRQQSCLFNQRHSCTVMSGRSKFRMQKIFSN
ncbi:unnamed protein product [Caretta caretta]